MPVCHIPYALEPSSLGDKMPYLAHPQHERRADDDDEPVLQAESAHVKELL